MFLPRYFIYLLPSYISWMGLSVCWLLFEQRRGKIAGGVVLALCLGGSLSGINEVYWPTKAPWRELAAEITKVPSSFVLTTRSPALWSPYYEHAGVEVEKLTPENIQPAYIQGLLEKYENIWIIENYHGGKPYLENFKNQLINAGLDAKLDTMQTQYSEPLGFMRIRKGVSK
jgi:hypothetical protein